jgi:Protein of unknown function (DUF3592)
MHALLDRLAILILGLLTLLSVAIIAFVGYLSAGYGYAVFRAYVSSQSWNTVHGEIVSANSAPGCGRYRDHYHLVVIYRYQIGSQKFGNDKVWFGNGYCSDKASVEAMAKSFAPGTTSLVYVNPKDSADSVLVRGTVANRTMAAFLVFSATFVGLLTFITITFQSERSSKRKSPNLDEILRRRESLDRSIRIEIEEPRNKEALAGAKQGDANPSQRLPSRSKL